MLHKLISFSNQWLSLLLSWFASSSDFPSFLLNCPRIFRDPKNQVWEEREQKGFHPKWRLGLNQTILAIPLQTTQWRCWRLVSRVWPMRWVAFWVQIPTRQCSPLQEDDYNPSKGHVGWDTDQVPTMAGTPHLKFHTNSLNRYLMTAYYGLLCIHLTNISWVPTMCHPLLKAMSWQIRQSTPAQLDLNLNICKAKLWGKYPVERIS